MFAMDVPRKSCDRNAPELLSPCPTLKIQPTTECYNTSVTWGHAPNRSMHLTEKTVGLKWFYFVFKTYK